MLSLKTYADTITSASGRMIELKGKVFDRLTTKEIPEVEIAVLNQDSTLAAKAIGLKKELILNKKTGQYKELYSSDYSISVPFARQIYILRFTAKGYKQKYLNVSLLSTKKRVQQIDVPNVFLSPEGKTDTLDDLIVTASKIKFYNKGDTLVYNADAFMLPEGSSLDALLKQMPGVEIKKGGKIYVNGRFVESLMLNGKDFFKGNNSVMLENLGAYTVKDIAVYDKSGDLAKLIGTDADIDLTYVMDVRLKKDYMTGWLVNAEAGAGTAKTYLAKLFALSYTNNSRLSLYGNANNLNDTNRPSDGSGWQVSTDNINGGISKILNGGIDYYIDNLRKTWNLSGNVDINYNNNEKESSVFKTLFLKGGDNYIYSFSKGWTKDLSVSTSHEYKLDHKSWNISLRPKFLWNHTDAESSECQGTFDEEWQTVNLEVLKNIYGGAMDDLRKSLINRNSLYSSLKSHGLNTGINGNANIKIPGTPDALALRAEGNYSRSSSFSTPCQFIDYGFQPESSFLSIRSNSRRPMYNFLLRGLAAYHLKTNIGQFKLGYEYRHRQQRKNADLLFYESDNASGETSSILDDVNLLPDFNNSHNGKLYSNLHSINPSWTYNKKWKKSQLKIIVSPHFAISHRHFFYHRGSLDTNIERTSFIFLNAKGEINWFRKNRSLDFSLRYEVNTKEPQMIDLIDFTDDVDPLNIKEGNPSLSNETDHNLQFSGVWKRNKYLTLRLSGAWNLQHNAIANGYVYNSSTGVRGYMAYNVGNNYTYYIAARAYGNMEPSSRFNYETQLEFDRGRFGDMIGVDSSPIKQIVSNQRISGSFGFSFDSAIFYGKIGMRGSFRHSTSEKKGFVNINAGDYIPQAEFLFKFPFGLQFGAELDILMRRGYVQENLNTTEFILNSELSYTIKGGQWIFKVKGYDLAGQLKNFSYAVNAQGRTETIFNSLRRYLLFSIQFRLDAKPRHR